MEPAIAAKRDVLLEYKRDLCTKTLAALHTTRKEHLGFVQTTTGLISARISNFLLILEMYGKCTRG